MRECPNCGKDYEEKVRPPNHVPDWELEYEEQEVHEYSRMCIERDGGVRDHGVPRSATIYLHVDGDVGGRSD